MQTPARIIAVLVALVFSIATMPQAVGADAVHHRPHRATRAALGHPKHGAPMPQSRRRPQLYGVNNEMFAMATRVATCEESGNWQFRGEVFDGGIGWTIANWRQFRLPGWPIWMHDAPPRMQANALFRFANYYHMTLPDQDGICRGY